MPEITPGKIIEDELHFQGWNISALTFKTKVNPQEWSDAISGRQPINDSLAESLSLAFGTSPDLWKNIQKLYDSKK